MMRSLRTGGSPPPRPPARRSASVARAWTAGVIGLALVQLALGCGAHRKPPAGRSAGGPNPVMLGAPQELARPRVTPPVEPLARQTAPPWTLRSDTPPEYWPLSLEEAVQLAMRRSQVVRDLGGRVVEAPLAITSRYDPALAAADPRDGEAAALSAFDAQFTTSLFWDHDERTFNNFFFGGGTAGLIQNTRDLNVEVSKITATGTRVSLRSAANYNQNNSPSNRFPGAWETLTEGEIRHPLLQGGGLEFNRIAGPNAQPGVYNGVLLARLRSDVAAIDFELAVRNLVRDVEQTYWELYFAYRDLDAKIRGRDAAQETWRVVRDKLGVGQEDSEREALVAEQFYSAQAAVETALSGDGAGPGVQSVERRLRWLLGLPPSDGRLIRPSDEPTRVDVLFPWEEVLAQALHRRPELRRQQWEIQRRHLELTAARNLLKPRLDVVGQYRFRGFGDELIFGGDGQNASAVEDQLGANLNGWRVGLELSQPVGNRIGHTAVRHAQLQLRRQRDLYREQELRVSHEASEAYAGLARSYQLTRTNFNRSEAAIRQWRAIAGKYEAGISEPGQPEILLENVLAAQSRAVNASVAFYRSLVDYNLALMNVHLAKGTLLDYHQVYLSEELPSAAALASAHRQSQRLAPRHAPCVQVPCPINAGPHDQRLPEQAPASIGPLETVPPPRFHDMEMAPIGALRPL